MASERRICRREYRDNESKGRRVMWDDTAKPLRRVEMMVAVCGAWPAVADTTDNGFEVTCDDCLDTCAGLAEEALRSGSW